MRFEKIIVVLLLGCLNLHAQNTIDILGFTSNDDAGVAYGLRKLSSSYSGPLVQIRNSSNQTKDISFTSSGFLNTANIKSFCTTGSCTVTIWYDQSGNNRNATQSKKDQQPFIYKNGVLMTKKGKPTLFFDYDITKKAQPNTIIFLETKPFKAFESGFTIYTAYGTKSASTLNPNTIISKTKNNIGAPWDIYNESFLTSNGGTWDDKEQSCMMSFGVNNNNDFAIWSFSADQKSKLKSSTIDLDSNNRGIDCRTTHYQDKNTAITIGSRADRYTVLNGWVSEMVVITNQMRNQGTHQKVVDNLIEYYDIDRDYNKLDLVGLESKYKPAAAFSLRKLSSDYDGSPILVKNSKSEYQDIGFTNNSLDTFMLKKFCGTGDCYVQTWYDQSGYERHASPMNENIAPLIMQNGKIIKLYGKPTIFFQNESSTSKKQRIALRTKAYSAYPDGMSLYISAGVKKDIPDQLSTFVTKTYGNVPMPWDMFENTIKFSGPSDRYPPHYYFDDIHLTNRGINSGGGFAVWAFNCFTLNSATYAGWNTSNNAYYPQTQHFGDSRQPLVIGSRNDTLTTLNGYVSEVISLSSFLGGESQPSKNITENMMSYLYGQSGNALNFDASNKNYIKIGSSRGLYDTGDPYTKEAWIYYDGGLTSQNIISSKDAFFIKQGKLAAKNNHGSAADIIAVEPLQTGVWTHVAVTYGGDTAKSGTGELILYINGQEKARAENYPSSTASQTYIGALTPSTNFNFNGNIDEVRIWSKVRTANEILLNYNYPIPSNSDGLISYYRFNEGIASGNNSGVTKLEDLTNRNQGLLHNFKLNGSTSNWIKSSVPMMDH